jgi:hypothetical protein
MQQYGNDYAFRKLRDGMGWLNTLPYGVYSLELSNGDEELKMRLVKRV